MGQIAVLTATLSVTNSSKLIGPHWVSGFHSPAHLLVLSGGWASAKWQMVPEISTNPWPEVSALPLSCPIVVRAGELKHWHRSCSSAHVCQDHPLLPEWLIRFKQPQYCNFLFLYDENLILWNEGTYPHWLTFGPGITNTRHCPCFKIESEIGAVPFGECRTDDTS